MKPNSISKVFFIFVVFTLVLSACNFPIRGSQSPTPVVQKLGTAVALTLTSAVTTVPTTLTDTPQPQASSPTASPSPTLTATPTITMTGTTTRTPLPDDPAGMLGNPSGKDTLDSGKGFGLTDPYEDQHTKISVSNGFMNVSNDANNGWRGWRVRTPKLKNFYLEGTFIVDSCGGNDQYGLVFRAGDFINGEGYYFGITCDGRYSLVRWDSGGTTSILNLTTSDKILNGAGQTNRLGVWATDNHIKLYANGKLLQEIDDSTFSEGYYGPFISGYSGNLSYRLDTISYWNQP